MGAQPFGVTAAAGEAPGTGQPVATVDPQRGAVVVPGAPGEPRARTGEDGGSGLVRHGSSGRRGRDVGLVDEPGRAGIGPGDSFVGLAVVEEMDLLAAQAFGQQQAQQILLGQRVHDFGRQLAPSVHLGTVRIEQRVQGAGTLRRADGESWRDKGLHERFLGVPVGWLILGPLERASIVPRQPRLVLRLGNPSGRSHAANGFTPAGSFAPAA